MLIFDIETDGLLNTVSKLWCVCTLDTETGEERQYHGDTLQDAIFALQEANAICGHNIIGYDIPALQKLYPEFKPKGLVRDTLVWARLAWSDIKQGDFQRVAKGTMPSKMIGRHSLEAYGYRLGEMKGDYGKAEDAWSEFNPEMLEYCIQDVRVTATLYSKLVCKGISDTAVCLEHQVAEIIQKQIQTGVYFDTTNAEQLYLKLIQRRATLLAELQRVFLPWFRKDKEFIPKKDVARSGYRAGCPLTKIVLTEFNPASRQHIAYQLKRRYGWQPEAFTDKGEPIVDETVLSKLEYPEAKLLSEYLMVEKRIGQLAEGEQAWLKQVAKDNRIHGNVITNGAVTGRMTHNNPNLAQVPAVNAPYGEECRSLFTVPKGRKLVGCDASGLELRCLAHYMARYDGGAYADVVLNGDIHTVNQKAAGLPTRPDAKRFIYAYLYGAGDAKIGEIIGGTAKEGAKVKAKFLKQTPALKKLKEAIDLAVKTKGYLIGLDGRHLPIRSPHAALNTLLQSAGAIIMKKALELQAEKIKNLDALFVLNIHDEFQMDCAEAVAETIGRMAVDSIREAGKHFNFRCPLDGEYKVGNDWKETH